LPPSFADFLKIWEPQTAETLRACQGLKWDCFTFTVVEVDEKEMLAALNIDNGEHRPSRVIGVNNSLIINKR
jgi:hypothetical protein